MLPIYNIRKFKTIINLYLLCETNGFFDIVLGGMNRAQELEDAVDFSAGKNTNIIQRER